MSFFNAVDLLTLKNRDYLKTLDTYLWQAYKEDISKGDITSKSFLKEENKCIEAVITANQNGILAGMEEAKWFLKKAGMRVITNRKDGEVVKQGAIVMKIKGKAGNILAGERTLLNLLQRMSGIATHTHKMVRRLPKDIRLLATRKTLWGAMDKKAVAIGGGETHRLNLSDAILIKDNHIKLSKNWEKNLIQTILSKPRGRFIEIEIQTNNQLKKFLDSYSQIKSKIPKNQNIVVMLDNFSPKELKKILPQFNKTSLTIEVSGGIDEQNIKKYCLPGVHAISSGSLTMRAVNLDMSLSIK